MVAIRSARRVRWLRRWAVLAPVAVGCGVAAALAASAQPAPPRVLTVALDGIVGPVTAEHLVDAVERGERDGYAAVVVLVDTPGGLDTSMRRVTQRFLAADVPVVAYVTPSGARAASAGAIITLASHVAAMAPGTVIGAATPVGLEGGDVERKVVNDAAALAESLAELRGRDVEFYVDAVREGRSAPADEALRIGAVEHIAGSLDELLRAIDGTPVTLPDRRVTLTTAGAAVDDHPMGLFRRLLMLLADPNLAFLFLSIGTLAVIYELASPGIGAGGAVGVILIVLAMFALSVLSVSITGIVFLVLAAVLFVAELFAPGVGVSAAFGAVALVLAGLFLFEDVPGVSVSLAVVLPTAVVVAVAVVAAGRLALRGRGTPSTSTGAGVLVGHVVTVRRHDAGRAQGFVAGAWWSLRSDRPLHAGEQVRVVAVDGLDLVVEPLDHLGATGRETANG